jgi:hypothetical protein
MKTLFSFLGFYITGFTWALVLFVAFFAFAFNPLLGLITLPLLALWDLCTEYNLFRQIHQLAAMSRGECMLRKTWNN